MDALVLVARDDLPHLFEATPPAVHLVEEVWWVFLPLCPQRSYGQDVVKFVVPSRPRYVPSLL